MRIKNTKCEVNFYNIKEPEIVFDFNDLIEIVIKSYENKNSIEFILVTGYDENEHKYSVRLDFGSIVTEQKELQKIFNRQENRISKLFGEILIEMGKLKREHLLECLILQAEAQYNKKIGEILIEKGYIKPQEVIEAITKQVTNQIIKK